MTLLDDSGPFRPGPGGLPPFLAGPEEEQSLFESRLAVLDRGEPPASEVVLYGPRGNGKTALLAWIQEVAAPSYAVDVIRLTPTEIRTGLNWRSASFRRSGGTRSFRTRSPSGV